MDAATRSADIPYADIPYYMKAPNVITHPTGWWPPRTVETTFDEVLEWLGRSQARA